MYGNKNQDHQDVLEMINDLMMLGNEVKVDMFAEPINPVDTKAIAFKFLLDDCQWHRFGYVVKEALDDVHSALASGQITDICFGWVVSV